MHAGLEHGNGRHVALDRFPAKPVAHAVRADAVEHELEVAFPVKVVHDLLHAGEGLGVGEHRHDGLGLEPLHALERLLDVAAQIQHHVVEAPLELAHEGAELFSAGARQLPVGRQDEEPLLGGQDVAEGRRRVGKGRRHRRPALAGLHREADAVRA